MGAVRLRRLILHNFRSFKGRHELDFPEKGLVILRGRNLDTRGDSGAGKTNVLLAIAYAFGFCRHSAKALQCKLDDKKMFVEVCLDTADGPVTLHRGDKLWLQTPIDKFEGSARAVEDELDRLCGVEAELREALTYRDQVEPKRFLAMKDRALKEFLVQVLRLQKLEKELEARIKTLTPFKARSEQTANNLDVFRKFEEEELSRRIVWALVDTKPLEEKLHSYQAAEALHQHAMDKTRREQKVAEAEELEQADAAAEVLRTKARELSTQFATLKAAVPPAPPEGPELVEAREKLATCEAHIKRVKEAVREAAQTYQAETERLRMDARKYHNELARLPDLQLRVDEKLEQLAKLQDGRCDRCNRPWDNTKVEIAQLIEDVKERQEAIAAIRAHREKAQELDAQLKARHFEPDSKLERLENVRTMLQSVISMAQNAHLNETLHVRAEHSRQVLEMDAQLKVLGIEIAQAYSAVLANPSRASLGHAERLRAMTATLGDIRMNVLGASSDLTAAITANRQEQLRAEDQERRIEEAHRKTELAEKEFQQADEAYRREADYVDLLKGFRNRIFDEVLEDIGNEASAVVGSLPNAAHMTVQFRSERETGSDTVRYEIKPVAYVHGEECSLDETASGGQLTSIGLAVDLAVIRIVSSRLGCNLNWVILDEAFNGHDTVTKQACLEVLQSYAADKLVIIVDHASEFKEMFTQTIEVVYEGKLSRLV